MFDDADLSTLGAAATATAAADAVRAERVVGCRMLEIAAHWADLYPGDGLSLEAKINRDGAERVTFYGGEGTPDVAEFAASRFGLECRKAPNEARHLIADALDLRHRLPLTWRLVRAAQVAPRLARRLAYRTRRLSQAMAMEVDQVISASICGLSFGRLETLIDAEIKRVDHERMEREAAAAARDASVTFYAPDENGMADLHPRMSALHALQSEEAINRLAHLLAGLKTLPDGVAQPAVNSHEAWREIALHLSTSNPVLAAQLWLQDQQPDLFDHPADSDGSGREVSTPTSTAWMQAPGRDRGDFIGEVIKGFDPAKLVPVNTLHVHLDGNALIRQDTDSDTDRGADHHDDIEHQDGGACCTSRAEGAVARVEEVGPTLLGVVRRWLASGTKIKLQPIIDTADIRPVDAYEVPDRMREALLARTPASCFPWSNSVNRHNQADHTDPFRRPPPRSTKGPPGQTGLHNLGPMPPPEHRYKTHGDITVHQPEPGTYLWKTGFGRILITNGHGTHDLGTGHLARTIWAASAGYGVVSPSG